MGRKKGCVAGGNRSRGGKGYCFRLQLHRPRLTHSTDEIPHGGHEVTSSRPRWGARAPLHRRRRATAGFGGVSGGGRKRGSQPR